MPPKFSKALLCAGLAAALVGCGGGSSTTPMPDSGSMAGTTAAETAANTVQRIYDSTKAAVDALGIDSSTSDIADARTAVSNFREAITSTPNLSSEKISDFTSKATELSGMITEEEDAIRMANAPKTSDDPDKSMPTANASAWLTGVSTYALGNVPSWPPATTLAGPTTNPRIRDGWTVTSYDYDDGNTMHEEGKTFSMEVEKVTPEIEMTWTRLAALSPLADRGDVIDRFLGGNRIMIDAITATPNPNPTGVTAGSGLVRQTITGVNIESFETPNAGEELAAFTPRPAADGANQVITTQFNIEDFIPMTAADLTSVDPANLPNGSVWANAATGGILRMTVNATDTPTDIRPYVTWKGIPGRLRFSGPTATNVLLARFHPTTGDLQIVPTGGNLPEGDRIVVDFQPVFSNRLNGVATSGIHNMNLILRDGETTTATTEFAYWASQNQSSSSVTVSTFARGGMGDMGFDAVTDMPEMLTGSAEYNGLAAGYYAMGTKSNGEFTADAMLTANFGVNTDSETITVSGMIDNFMSITNDDNLSSWNLTLSPVMLNDDNLGNAFSGRTSGGDALGNWNGQFLGMANPGINLEDAADRADDYPQAVVGNFRGHFADNGHVAGAFGADLEE